MDSAGPCGAPPPPPPGQGRPAAGRRRSHRSPIYSITNPCGQDLTVEAVAVGVESVVLRLLDQIGRFTRTLRPAVTDAALPKSNACPQNTHVWNLQRPVRRRSHSRR